MAYGYSRNQMLLAGGAATGTLTGAVLDSAFTYETGGDAWFVRFVSPITQVSGALTLYVWCSAVTGSPTDVRCDLYNGPGSGEDVDRPDAGGAALVSSGAVDFSAAAGSWVTFSLTGVSLTASQCYYLIADNRTATPTSHYPTITYRPLYDIHAVTTSVFIGGVTANGFTTDPTITTGMAACVLKFNDGTLIGDPWVSGATHAVDSNDRGNRFQFDEDVVVSGIRWVGGGAAGAGVEINAASGGANVVTVALDDYGKFKSCTRWGPVTLTGGSAYDAVLTVTSNAGLHTVYGMGVAEGSVPADVLACRWNGVGAYVDGATPGSYTVDTSKWMPMLLIVDSNPAISSGGMIPQPKRFGIQGVL